MNTKSFDAGYKTFNTTIDAAKHVPIAFCDFGNAVRSKTSAVTGSIAGFFAGMRHASRIRSGKCKLMKCLETK